MRMSGTKAKVTCDKEHSYDAFIYNERGRLVAFSEMVCKQILQDNGIPYKFEKVDDKSHTRYMREKRDLVLFPGTDKQVVINPIEIPSEDRYSEGGWEIDAKNLGYDIWLIHLGNDNDPIDIISYAELCYSDIGRYVDLIISSYLDAFGDDVNVRAEFLRMLLWNVDYGDNGNLRAMVTAKQEEDREGYAFCKGCKELVPNDEFHEKREKVTRTECTYTDAGYGDDDMFGDVTRLVTFRVCNRCGTEEEIDSMYLSTANERRRIR